MCARRRVAEEDVRPRRHRGEIFRARGRARLRRPGIALLQARGGEIIEVYPGQTVYTPPGEEHWHGAAPGHFMEHLAMFEAGDDPATATTWLEHVSDEEYHRP